MNNKASSMNTKKHTPSRAAVLPSRPVAAPHLTVLLASLFAVAPLAHGAGRAEQPETFQGGEIVTTAPRLAGGVESIGTVREVTAAEIRRKGARTLDEAIALLPGINIRNGADGTPRIDMRGLVTRQIKLFINGVPFNSTYDGQFDPTLIPVDAIARIKVTMGASSMLYGDGDVAGVIDIITKQGAGAPHLGNAGLEYGTGGHYFGHAGLSGATGRSSYYLSASALGRNWLPTPSGFNQPLAGDSRHLYNSDQRRGNVYGNLGYRATDALSFNLTATHTEGANGLPLLDTNSKSDPYAPQQSFERIGGINGNTAQLTASYAPGGHWSGKSWIYYNALSENDNRYDNANYNTATGANTFLTQNRTRIPGAHAQASYDAGNAGNLAVAVDGRREYWSQSGSMTMSTTNKKTKTTTYSQQVLADERSVGVHSAAVEYSVTPVARTHLTAGYSRYWQARDSGSNEAANGYLLGGAYDLGTATQLRASLSQHVRFPSIQQLYDATQGNQGLRVETGRNAEAGIEHHLSAHTRLGATVFRDDVHNFINMDPISQHYQNNAHYLFKGIELTAHAQPFARLDLGASYTYLRADDLSPGAAFEALQYRPRNKATASVAYAFGAGWQVYADADYVGQQYYYSKPKNPPVTQASLSRYTLVNLKVSKRLPHTHASVYLGANNLLNKAYQTSYGFYQAGRVVYAGVESAL
jgi:vitamin B12 transporter